MQVDECIASIMVYQEQQEREFLNAVYKLYVVHHPKYDREIEFLSKLVSEHACELVFEQYQFATTTAKHNFHEAVPGVYLIQSASDEEDALDEPLSEYFALNFENIIPTQLLNSRWLLASLRVESELPQLCGESFRVSRVLKETNTCWDFNRKFREANFIATSISEQLSRLGMVEYRVAMDALRGVAKLFKRGQYNTIPGLGGNPGFEYESSSIIVDTAGNGNQQTSEGAMVTKAVGVVQVTKSNTFDTASLSMVSASSVESTQVGAESLELGTGSVELGTEGKELRSGNEPPNENKCQCPELVPANLTDFEIVSPPRARGRLKQKPKAVKAKRKQTITMVQDDLDMHDRQMSLLSVRELLDGEPTYTSSHEKLLQFKQFMFSSRPKAPIAHEIAKLPPTKPLIQLEEVVRVFPMELINKCMAKVTAYQSKKGSVGDATSTGDRRPCGVHKLDYSAHEKVAHGPIVTDRGHFKRALVGATKSMKVLWPINCNNNHWCAVLMDLQKGRVYIYDSMATSYTTSVRVVAEQLITTLAADVRPSSRFMTHDPGLGVQTDSYNCGVYVLLAFELFCGSEPLGHLDKKTLQCMRYRYLCMCMAK
ncbi:unnamed protein product [Phytophthora fragariaefolia]|uniref:Unnamed protein product n=1 Tax=Phytophthora fragariaefolia TaxID=1490495 RepID=A0A9W6Y8R4_9STRA|nr:unnamed protein product [Phytophthora fragariaefolia]